MSGPATSANWENVIRKFLVLRNADLVAEELLRRAYKRGLAAGRIAPVNEAPSQKMKVLPSVPPRSLGSAPEAPSAASSILTNVNSAHKAAEAEAIVAALNASMWNRKQAAALLKIEYKALLYKMKKLGIGEKKSA